MAPTEASPKPDPLEGTSGRRFVADDEGARPGDVHQHPRQEERESVDGDYIGYDPDNRHGSAYTAQLVDHLEQASGVDLSTFMQNWYVGQGFPTYILNWAQEGNGPVSVHLDQTTSHASVPFYAMPVPIKLKNAEQDSTIILDHGFSGQLFTVDIPFPTPTACCSTPTC